MASRPAAAMLFGAEWAAGHAGGGVDARRGQAHEADGQREQIY